MLTGELPFKGPNFLAQKREMIYESATPIVSDLPKQIDEIIKNCFQAKKESRFRTVAELSTTIKEVQK